MTPESRGGIKILENIPYLILEAFSQGIAHGVRSPPLSLDNHTPILSLHTNLTQVFSFSFNMGYATDSAKWPSNIEPLVKKLFDLFFTLVDSKAANSGERLSQEVFTKDGVFIPKKGTFKGSEGK